MNRIYADYVETEYMDNAILARMQEEQDRKERNQAWLDTLDEDRRYYEENIEAFLEYKSHMGEPDFDWDFYSDWHKDMYGCRPR